MKQRGTDRALVVDDDLAVGKTLVKLLEQAGFPALHVPSAEEALSVFASESFDVVLTDVRMKGMDGLALLRELKRSAPEVPVIVLTAHGSIATAVEAMRLGAADFLTKPFDREEIVFTIRKALDITATALASPPKPDRTGETLVGSSADMREIAALVQRAAASSSNVLIRGESGTGKEVVARAIHDGGRARTGPFVAVNCAAIPETLFESELFGYERGAFTGAVSRRPGRVEIAKGGTLFLDEIGDAPLAAQAKLLRLLQEKEYQPLGGVRTEKADVRLIAATHRNLETMFRDGEFREDLYYRLNVIPIWLPALRDRPGDVPELARRFAASIEGGQHRRLKFTEAAMQCLTDYAWPGNVRELMCVIERLAVFTDGDLIDEADAAREIARMRRADPSSKQDDFALAEPPPSSSPPSSGSLTTRRAEAERVAILDALGRSQHNRTKAARLLGISRRTLYNRIVDLSIARELPDSSESPA